MDARANEKVNDMVAARLRVLRETLDAIIADRDMLQALPLDERTALLTATGAVFEPDIELRRQRAKQKLKRDRLTRVSRDEDLRSQTVIRSLRAKDVYVSPNVYAPSGFLASGEPERVVQQPLHCYICKRKYTSVHPFYDQMCQPCGDFNQFKRTELADLRGRVALLTGGRVKIGYQAGLKLLRAGVQLIVTTRFPRDSAKRYANEPDFDAWRDRLEIFGLDLRHTPSVEAFCSHLLATRTQLDFIINNACQTVRRPPAFYRHMLEAETESLTALPSVMQDKVAGLTHSAGLSQLPLLADEFKPAHHLFPEGRLDQDLQQVDLRGRNSWRLTLAEVSSVELIETQLVNAVAPFVLNARLKQLMLRTATRDKHIVNVSAVEGQFYRRMKTTRHPHTNMAKAALNMMTRTSAADYHGSGIHMNSVDTGWVSDEDPHEVAQRKRAEHRFHPPLDIVDGAARIVDPIISGVNSGDHVWGQFLKDYRPTDW
jgi:NAD(P)-dependent dehydrogenase (short-subunit alcohol dehydrogenase family)